MALSETGDNHQQSPSQARIGYVACILVVLAVVVCVYFFEVSVSVSYKGRFHQVSLTSNLDSEPSSSQKAVTSTDSEESDFPEPLPPAKPSATKSEATENSAITKNTESTNRSRSESTESTEKTEKAVTNATKGTSSSEQTEENAAPASLPSNTNCASERSEGENKPTTDSKPITFDVFNSPFQVSEGAKAVCHQFPQPKVAVVLLGHPRSFFLPSVYRTLRANLIEAFGGEPTVFITLLEATRELRGVKYDLGKIIDRDVDKTVFDDALKALRPAHVQWHDSKGPDELMNKDCVWNDPWDNKRMFRYLSQIHSLEVAWPPVLEYEKQHNMRFDVVIRARPDLLFSRGIDPYCMFPMDTVFSTYAIAPNWMPAADHVHIIPRQFADDFFNQVAPYKICQKSLPFDPNMCCGGGPTGYSVAYLKWKNIPHVWEKRGDGFGPFIPAYLVRNPGELDRVQEMCKVPYGADHTYFPNVDTCMKVLYKPAENPY